MRFLLFLNYMYIYIYIPGNHGRYGLPNRFSPIFRDHGSNVTLRDGFFAEKHVFFFLNSGSSLWSGQGLLYKWNLFFGGETMIDAKMVCC